MGRARLIWWLTANAYFPPCFDVRCGNPFLKESGFHSADSPHRQKDLWTCHWPSDGPSGWRLFLQSFIQRPRSQNKMWLERQHPPQPLRPEDSGNIFGMQSVLAVRLRPSCS